MPQLLAGFLSLLTLQYRPQCRVHLAPADIVCKNWVQSARFSKSVGGGRDFSLVSGGAVELVSASCALGGVPEAVGHVAQLFANGHTVNETKQSTSFCASYHELTGLKGAHPRRMPFWMFLIQQTLHMLPTAYLRCRVPATSLTPQSKNWFCFKRGDPLMAQNLLVSL